MINGHYTKLSTPEEKNYPLTWMVFKHTGVPMANIIDLDKERMVGLLNRLNNDGKTTEAALAKAIRSGQPRRMVETLITILTWEEWSVFLTGKIPFQIINLRNWAIEIVEENYRG